MRFVLSLRMVRRVNVHQVYWEIHSLVEPVLLINVRPINRVLILKSVSEDDANIDVKTLFAESVPRAIHRTEDVFVSRTLLAILICCVCRVSISSHNITLLLNRQN